LEWTADQQHALKVLSSSKNVFLTGGAGTGKSTVIRHFIQEELKASKSAAVLASTGTAAILLGGRTFHSFFGLGIMEGGLEKVVERASRHAGIVQRLKKAELVLIDEVSMLGAAELTAADLIAQKARKLKAPWGGLRVVMVGDFAQLPPITQNQFNQNSFGAERPSRPWCFQSEPWIRSDLENVVLSQIVRSQESSWNQILAEVRWADLSEYAVEQLQRRQQSVPLDFQGTRLFARRAQVDALNHERLEKLSGKVREYNTIYLGVAAKVDELKRNAPIPEVLLLKEGALVMFRQNDPEYRFVNGTLGTVTALKDQEVQVQLLSGKTIDLKPQAFSVLDAEGEVVATATNFPLNLAWACTIHKAQGATLDRVHANLKGVWEHGQSYVALSRVRSVSDLTIEGLSPRVFLTDPLVKQFYERLSMR
jgi:ATP-dependent DNA helicase PIF1